MVWQIGTNMGLSRLGAERPNLGTSDPRWVGRWSSIVDREVGRRIWWNLVGCNPEISLWPNHLRV